MSIPTRFCQKCSTNLCRLGLEYLDIFKNICENYVEDKEPIEISDLTGDFTHLFSIISVLEKNGYVISTETGIDLVKIKPLGIHCSHLDSDPFFPTVKIDHNMVCYVCLKDGNH